MTPNEFVNENYDSILYWLEGVSKGKKEHIFEDFVHEVIITFLEHDKAQQAVDTGTARFFIARIGLNMFRSRTSTLHYKYRDSFKDAPEDWDAVLTDTYDEQYDYEQDAMIEVVLSALDELYAGNKWDRYEAMIVMIYHTMGDNYSEVGRRLEMNRATVRKVYVRGITKLKTIIDRRLNDGDFSINSNISSDWGMDSSSNKQQAISTAAQLFKTRYFDTF